MKRRGYDETDREGITQGIMHDAPRNLQLANSKVNLHQKWSQKSSLQTQRYRAEVFFKLQKDGSQR